MKVAGGGFEQCYNTQLAVDMDSLLIVQTNTVPACNDKQQIEPMLKKLSALPDELGNLTMRVADTGYYSEAKINACGKNKVTPPSLPSAGKNTIPTRWNVSPHRRPWARTRYRQNACATTSRRRQVGPYTPNANTRWNP